MHAGDGGLRDRPARRADLAQPARAGHGDGAGGEVAGQRGGPRAPPCRPCTSALSSRVTVLGLFGEGAGGEVAGQRGGPRAPPCRPCTSALSSRVTVLGLFGEGAGGEVAGQRGGPRAPPCRLCSCIFITIRTTSTRAFAQGQADAQKLSRRPCNPTPVAGPGRAGLTWSRTTQQSAAEAFVPENVALKTGEAAQWVC